MVSDAETMFAECAAGSGIAQVNENAVRELLGRKKLIELFPEWNGEARLIHSTRFTPRGITNPRRSVLSSIS